MSVLLVSLDFSSFFTNYEGGVGGWFLSNKKQGIRVETRAN